MQNELRIDVEVYCNKCIESPKMAGDDKMYEHPGASQAREYRCVFCKQNVVVVLIYGQNQVRDS